MRLTDLHPRFYGAGGPGIFNADMTPATPRSGIGVSFDCPCPTCTAKRTGDHDHDWYLRHFVAFKNPLDGGPTWTSHPTEPTWQRTGETFETLQLSPSILSDPTKGGCGWHGYVGLSIPGEVT